MLDLEDFCIAIRMHSDFVFEEDGKDLISLLKDGERKVAAKTYMEMGKSSKSLCTSEEFIEKLVDSQYDDYEGIEDLRSYKNNSYVQVIEHPSIKNAQMTLADDKSGVKAFNDSDPRQ